MEITKVDKSGQSIIKINKDKILGTEGMEFQQAVLQSLDQGIKKIEIDLSDVNYITSWGIGMLVHAFTTTTNREGIFALTGVNNKVKTILSKVKMDKILNIKESVVS